MKLRSNQHNVWRYANVVLGEKSAKTSAKSEQRKLAGDKHINTKGDKHVNGISTPTTTLIAFQRGIPV